MRWTNPDVIDAARERHRTSASCPMGPGTPGHRTLKEAYACDLTGHVAAVMDILDEVLPEGTDWTDALFPPEGAPSPIGRVLESLYMAGVKRGTIESEIEFGVRDPESGKREPFLVVRLSAFPEHIQQLVARRDADEMARRWVEMMEAAAVVVEEDGDEEPSPVVH